MQTNQTNQQSPTNSNSEFLFHEFGLELGSRTIYLGSMGMDWDGNEAGVDHVMAQTFIKNMYLLDQKDGPITIISNNPGGDWYHGLAIYDCIKATRNRVKMIMFGYAMSMGSIILQAADERIMAPHSMMMLHYGYTSQPYDHPKVLERWAEQSKSMGKVMEDIYLPKIRVAKPGFRLKELQKILTFDTYLTAPEAIEWGLADALL